MIYKKIYLIIIFLILFNSCSSKNKLNEWRYNSAIAFNSYQKDFLQGNDLLAKSNLNRAIKYAKRSANLTQLARIYLGSCALNRSVGQKDNCQKYLYISNLSKDKFLISYYKLITLNLDKINIDNLPSTYKKFATNLQQNNLSLAINNILDMKKISSQLISASLIKKNIDNNMRKKMIKISSTYGYKKAVIFWLKELKKYIHNTKDRTVLEKKIEILTI